MIIITVCMIELDCSMIFYKPNSDWFQHVICASSIDSVSWKFLLCSNGNLLASKC